MLNLSDYALAAHVHRIARSMGSPLIMSFRQFQSLAPGQMHISELAKIPEAAYRA